MNPIYTIHKVTNISLNFYTFPAILFAKFPSTWLSKKAKINDDDDDDDDDNNNDNNNNYNNKTGSKCGTEWLKEVQRDLQQICIENFDDRTECHNKIANAMFELRTSRQPGKQWADERKKHSERMKSFWEMKRKKSFKNEIVNSGTTVLPKGNNRYNNINTL